MSLFITSLNSGSNANCYYIGNHTEAILVDAGLSCRETMRRMQKLELSMEKVRAIFISHEHSDHISGLVGLSRKYQVPVYITPPTLAHSKLPLDPALVHPFQKNIAVSIGNLAVLPFSKSHDAADPYSFIISGFGVNIGVITDIGYACKQVIKHFQLCDAVFLESNYCDDMLANGSYPYHLKRRISGDHGHLSNAQALELFIHYRSPGLKLLVLSHLSKNNNRPELVETLFREQAGSTQIIVASRYEPTPVFCVEPSIHRKQIKIKTRVAAHDRQLSLF